MNEPSSPIVIPDEKIEVESEVTYENRHSIDSTELKLNGASAGGFPPRSLIRKRKAKRKDDGPLEIVCGFIIEHQIGTMNLPRISSRIRAN
jgi:acyl-CoA-dependent ceramide synthase